MNEKRFTLSVVNEEKGIWRIYDAQGLTMITLKGVEERLNQLHQENQSLKFELDECANNKLYSRRKLEEENEQLKNRLNAPL